MKKIELHLIDLINEDHDCDENDQAHINQYVFVQKIGDSFQRIHRIGIFKDKISYAFRKV